MWRLCAHAKGLKFSSRTLNVGGIDNSRVLLQTPTMRAELLLRKRLSLSETLFVDISIWRVPDPVRGSAHDFKYSLALVSENVCVLRYDNEAGKGDHKHVRDREVPYLFQDLQTLQDDFWKDAEAWMTAR